MKYLVTGVFGFIDFHSTSALATKCLCEQGDDVYWLI